MERNFCCHLSLDVHKMNMKFRVQNLTVLCSLHKVFYPAFGQHLLWLGGDIGEFHTSKYIYIYIQGYILLQLSHRLQCFQFIFYIAFRSFGFLCHFFISLFLLQVQYFSVFVTCSICIFWERRLASNGLQTLAKGTLDQCLPHTVLTYFSLTLNR